MYIEPSCALAEHQDYQERSFVIHACRLQMRQCACTRILVTSLRGSWQGCLPENLQSRLQKRLLVKPVKSVSNPLTVLSYMLNTH